MVPPIVVYCPLAGRRLAALNLMVDALRLLDAVGEAEAAADLVAAIDHVVQSPVNSEADRALFDRLEAYFETVTCSGHPHSSQCLRDGDQASIQ